MGIRTIAIVTEGGMPGKEINENTQINVFRLEEDRVLGYESIMLESSDNNKLSMLIKLKEISLIYIDTLSNELRHLLQKRGVCVKCRDQWEDDEFIGKFVFN